MAELVKIFIVITLFSILLWRNHRYHVGFSNLENNRVCSGTAICQKIFRLEALNLLCRNCAIRCSTKSDKESHRHTMCIHGQMYLGVGPLLCGPCCTATLIYICDFLGHVHVETTEIYAKTDTEMKHRAIESAHIKIDPDLPV